MEKWSSMRDLPNLDFVRSVAVISVVVEHTLLALGIRRLGPFPIQYLGVMGVMVFFVLTTLVLMWSLERKPHMLDFYIRRIFRIYPLAAAAIGMAVVLHVTMPDLPQSMFDFGNFFPRNILSQFTLLSTNMGFRYAPIIGALWSLPYELEMYVLLPALFFLLRKNFAIWPLVMFWVMSVLLTRRVPNDHHNFGVAIGYFLPGCMAYVGFGRWRPRLAAWTLPIILALLWAAFLLRANFHTGWFACLALGLGLPMFRQMKANWLIVSSRMVAKYSYGIYLMHSFAIVFGLNILRSRSLGVRLVAEAVSLIVLTGLAYHLLENPLIKIGAKLAATAEERYEQHEMKSFREKKLVNR
jgi:peptidoglycan/LPS O-acetylase OafA/YrhL